MADNVTPLVARRHHRPTTPPVAVTAAALIYLAQERASNSETGIDLILHATLPGIRSADRWALYLEIGTWIDDLDAGTGPEYDRLTQRAHDTIHTLVAQAVGR